MNYPTPDHVTPTVTNEQAANDHMLTGIHYARPYAHGGGLTYDIVEHAKGSNSLWSGSATSYAGAIRIARALNEQSTRGRAVSMSLDEAASQEEAKRAAQDPH